MVLGLTTKHPIRRWRSKVGPSKENTLSLERKGKNKQIILGSLKEEEEKKEKRKKTKLGGQKTGTKTTKSWKTTRPGPTPKTQTQLRPGHLEGLLCQCGPLGRALCQLSLLLIDHGDGFGSEETCKHRLCVAWP